MDATSPWTNTPQRGITPLLAGHVRRTTCIDIVNSDDRLFLRGVCVDRRRSQDGASVVVVSSARLTAELAAGHRLTSLELDPPASMNEPLTGLTVGAGFRRRARSSLACVEPGTPLFALIDDLPVATLISGYGKLYNNSLGSTNPSLAMVDVCSGWRNEGLMMTEIRATGRMPVPVGPEAPRWDDGPQSGWERETVGRPGDMRRARLIDVAPDGSVFATFRDTHFDNDAVERVLHEYSLRATFDGASGLLDHVIATPESLPWDECPHAAASALRLSGTPAHDLRERIAVDFRGTTTCTHLNDLLRTLADLPTLSTAQ